jgi:hypothetical protein
MSCGLAVAAALLLSDPTVTAVQAPPPATLAEEPMYADIVSRSRTLKAIVDGWIAEGAAQDQAFAERADFVDFRTAALELSERDMAGHLDLRERGTDGDLRCILRGLSEDLTVRVDELATAATPGDRTDALSELAYLLNDNVEVVIAPPGPDAGAPPH